MVCMVAARKFLVGGSCGEWYFSAKNRTEIWLFVRMNTNVWKCLWILREYVIRAIFCLFFSCTYVFLSSPFLVGFLSKELRKCLFTHVSHLPRKSDSQNSYIHCSSCTFTTGQCTFENSDLKCTEKCPRTKYRELVKFVSWNRQIR